mmetsp:Transcript_74188/g.172066  ORF Transcript_74188/g.172066 Transcript_74188/m.172066 type:complete len:344 (-) Transcript_74188:86-1117(-)|eukprot:CAMPEP_0171091032 /NCGR_PEP_ID=MMETSP0766_2-20121228/32197_1 /TAXON_ID=439317 /ORGANISM="Gambierdiscus australes, Strain CAWD 149" /LENGTH=343 /DNA_ID=CAMNT_0011549089 /DNA_START=60 /DNA_END=1091 /DNA_ORIENTATION=-
MKVQNRQVSGQSKYKRAAPIFHQEDHHMHMLIAALDYEGSRRPLSCSTEARSVEELARQCGVQGLKTMYNEQCTKEALLAALRQLGSQCGPDDYFIFYFAGHGTGLGDAGGDEVDGEQEAFVCVNRTGQVSPETLLSDDDFCAQVLPSLHMETRILMLTDCLHSEAIVNLSKAAWQGRQAISITGCQDAHYAEDVDRSGIFTHALLLAIDKLSKVGRDNYSVGMLFNATLYEDELVFGSKQDLSIQIPPKFSSDEMAWPLVPPVGYQAPLSRCAAELGNDHGGGTLSPAGVSASVLVHVAPEALNVPVSIEEYVNHVQGGAIFQLKPCRACTAGCATGQCSVQ